MSSISAANAVDEQSRRRKRRCRVDIMILQGIKQRESAVYKASLADLKKN
jgi:hypothetical protein